MRISVALFSSPNHETVCKKTIEGEKKSKSMFSTKHKSFHNSAPACFSSTAFQSPPPRVTLGFRPSNTGLFLSSESLQILFSLPGRSFSLPSTGGCLQSFQDLGILNLMKPFLILSVRFFFFLHIIKITHFVYSSMGSDQQTLTYLPQSRYRIYIDTIISSKITCTPLQSTVSLPGNHQLVYHPSSFAFSRIS